jgi:hypothetical protein
MGRVSRGLTRALLIALACLLAWRLAYHAAYLAFDPFARATFSDGSVYEDAARDVLAHPPLGTHPFYLQGAYAYLLALGMSVWPSITAGLLLQLACAALALWAAQRALAMAFGARAGTLAFVALLGYFPLAFYENKYLSASLGVDANVLAWLAFALFVRRRNAGHALLLGAASGLGVLARPNLLLALPFTLIACALVSERSSWRTLGAAWLCGLALALAPMALRNTLVTGKPSVFPAHGGGTSFYIGNNPQADGRWNTAGGLLSGQVGLERKELLRELGLPERSEAEDAAAIGSALYARAFRFIREQPLAEARLELRKLWLSVGNDEISQDYDPLGERALLGAAFGWGVPFGILLALALCGCAALLARDDEPRTARAWLWLLLGQGGAVAAANLVYFTSSQHRLPLAVVCAALAGPGAEAAWLAARARMRRGHDPRAPGLVVSGLAVVLLAQAFVPRQTRTRPSVAHFYNLSVVQEQTGDLAGAAASLGTALARKPREPVFSVEHASLLRRLGRFEEASDELDRVRAFPNAPAWVHARERLERALLEQRSRADALSRAP